MGQSRTLTRKIDQQKLNQLVAQGVLKQGKAGLYSETYRKKLRLRRRI